MHMEMRWAQVKMWNKREAATWKRGFARFFRSDEILDVIGGHLGCRANMPVDAAPLHERAIAAPCVWVPVGEGDLLVRAGALYTLVDMSH